MLVSFVEEEYILPESTSDGMGGYVPVCVELEGATQRPVTVYVSTSGGTATGRKISTKFSSLIHPFSTEGTDYTAIDSMEIILAPDASPWQNVVGDTQCFNVTAVNDNSLESNETFLISISGSDDCAEVCTVDAEILIDEDDDCELNSALFFLFDLPIKSSC